MVFRENVILLQIVGLNQRIFLPAVRFERQKLTLTWGEYISKVVGIFILWNSAYFLGISKIFFHSEMHSFHTQK